MKKILLTFAFIITLWVNLSWADQLIIEPDMGRTPIINAINDARYTIDLVSYGFTDDQLLNSFLQQKKNGKTIKILLEQAPYKADDENQKAFAALNKARIDWQGSIPPYRLIHQKTLIVDGKKAYIMTFNFTNSTFKNERNFALVIDDAKRVNEIEAVFAADWNHKAAMTHSLDLIFSPDDSRQKLMSLISRANKSIKIYAQSVNDYNMVGALAKAARKGVTVEILTSNKMREKQADYLQRAGVITRQSKKYYIHAKVFIIDNKKAAIGSINLTKASLDENRELAVITYDPTVIAQLNSTFENDWNNGNNAYSNQLKKFMPDKRMVMHTLKWINRLAASR